MPDYGIRRLSYTTVTPRLFGYVGRQLWLVKGRSRFEREQVPVISTLPDARRSNLLSRKAPDCVMPETIRRLVGNYDANFPAPAESASTPGGQLECRCLRVDTPAG